jgi:hypothetical protein
LGLRDAASWPANRPGAQISAHVREASLAGGATLPRPTYRLLFDVELEASAFTLSMLATNRLPSPAVEADETWQEWPKLGCSTLVAVRRVEEAGAWIQRKAERC